MHRSSDTIACRRRRRTGLLAYYRPAENCPEFLCLTLGVHSNQNPVAEIAGIAEIPGLTAVLASWPERELSSFRRHRTAMPVAESSPGVNGLRHVPERRSERDPIPH
jgi:hypothetical protein